MSCLSDTNLCRIRGDTNSLVVQLLAGTTPINISGDSFLLTVDPDAEPASSANNLFQVAGAIIDAPNGKVAFTLTTPQAATEPGDYFYDVQWTHGSSIRTVLKGGWQVKQDITK